MFKRCLVTTLNSTFSTVFPSFLCKITLNGGSFVQLYELNSYSARSIFCSNKLSLYTLLFASESLGPRVIGHEFQHWSLAWLRLHPGYRRRNNVWAYANRDNSHKRILPIRAPGSPAERRVARLWRRCWHSDFFYLSPFFGTQTTTEGSREIRQALWAALLCPVIGVSRRGWFSYAVHVRYPNPVTQWRSLKSKGCRLN